MGLKINKGAGTINQHEHLDDAAAKKVTPGILIPGAVVTTNISTAPVLVGKNNICRIRVSATTYVAFGDSTLAAVTSSTSPALELGAGTYLVTATDDFIRASAAAARLEVIDG